MKIKKIPQNRSVYVIFIVVAVFVVFAWVLVRFANTVGVPAEVRSFVAETHMPYQPLLPTHLPAGSQLKADSQHSFYNPESQMLTLRWVFPAQTLPGQGTLIIYQADKTVSFLMPINPDKTVKVNGADASLGDLQTSVDVPSSPGRRAIAFLQDGRQIVIVSYAISDEELIKVASSLHSYTGS